MITRLKIIEDEYPDEKFNQADGFDAAIIGFEEESGRLIYSKQKMVYVLVERDKMSFDEAIDFLEFNTFGTKGEPNGMPLPIWCDDMMFF